MNKDDFIIFLVVLVSVVGTYFYIIYGMKAVEKYLGSFFSLCVAPALAGGIVGICGTLILGKKNDYLWLPIIGVIASLTPVGLGVFVVLQASH